MTWMLCDCGDCVWTWFMPINNATMNAMRPKASENVIIVILLNQAQDFGKVKAREFVSDVTILCHQQTFAVQTHIFCRVPL
jgi:hypothetical protein